MYGLEYGHFSPAHFSPAGQHHPPPEKWPHIFHRVATYYIESGAEKTELFNWRGIHGGNVRSQSVFGPRVESYNNVPCRQCFCEVLQRHPFMTGEHDEELPGIY